MSKILFQSVVLLVVLFTFSTASANISGAIFTTDGNCIGTNVNQFGSKMAVYLDGGPNKIGSAGLPDGYYYVQVTSPNGELLGTTDGTLTPAPVHVVGGEFVQCYQLWAILIKASNSSQGYDDTPNTGGVYKVWITRDVDFEREQGFANAWSKTDNFKVSEQGNPPACETAEITILKFDDSDANGIKDIGENDINWPVEIIDPCGSSSGGVTTLTILAPIAGTWQICEESPGNWLQTALIVDGVPFNPAACAAVDVIHECNEQAEQHTVVFGNIQLGSITACKFIDSNVNGGKDAGEPPLEGIRFTLDGNDVKGTHIHQEQTTSSNGCVTFDGLLPGSYTLCEVLPPNWTATTDICQTVELGEGDNPSFDFGNVCTGTAAFGTKGYWHNKNGLDETVQADFNDLNSLDPWKTQSSYFGAGDEPIDGKFSNGNPIPAARDASRKVIALAGTSWAEQSYFLIDKNSGGDPREQLAQQLDAFIMNVRHRLECGPDTMIQKPDGTWVSASGLIDQAINVWNSGSASERTTMSTLLDALNNSIAVVFVQCTPCDVAYP